MINPSAHVMREFANHEAIVNVASDDVTIIDWRNPESSLYSIRYILSKNYLYVSGDLGSAVYYLTWEATPSSFLPIEDLYYFAEKLEAFSGQRTIFSKRQLQKSVDDYRYELIDEVGMEIYKVICMEAMRCGTLDDWLDRIRYHEIDFINGIEEYGNCLNPRIEFHLAGIQMAVSQWMEKTKQQELAY